MSLLSTVERIRERTIGILGRLGWLAPLFLRLSLFATFAPTGWGKVHDLATPTDYFTELHIPFPHFNAILVSYTELIGGSLLLIGLLSRPAAVPLFISMVVALITAKRESLHGVMDLLAVDEFLYLVMLLVIILCGPGQVSLDYFIDRLLRKREAAAAGKSTE